MLDTPFRFSVQANQSADRRAWATLSQTVEDLGFHALYVPDHVGACASPFTALAAAAAVTSTLKVGTYVANAGLRDPLMLATDAATVDRLSDGRLVLGLGAGHTPEEWTMQGKAYPLPRARVDRLAEVIEIVTRLFKGDVVTVHGRHVTVVDACLRAPLPATAHIPLLVGGNGIGVCRLGGQRADIVSLTGLGPTLADGHHHAVQWSDASIDRRVAAVRSEAHDQGRQPVLDALVQHVEITRDRSGAAARLADTTGISPEQLLHCPYVLIGTLPELVEQVNGHRDRWGFTSYVVRAEALEATAALMGVLN